MSARALEVLNQVDAVVGYATYIELIRPLVAGKTLIGTPMTKEVDRVENAIRIAVEGACCAIISSGDPGIYAMAGLVIEVCQKNKIAVGGPQSRNEGVQLSLEIVPGIPALCAGAALLGAPLTHDFAVISLSDLLTAWQVIENRLTAAARADFTIVLYNPKSKRRKNHLEKAQAVIMQYRDPATPVGIVRRAMRQGQSVEIISLADLASAEVDMQTTIFVGNSTSVRYRTFLLTPRGYGRKYDLTSAVANPTLTPD